MNGDVGRGSARSYAGLDVGAAFASVADLLVAHGGHRQAAGLTVERSRLETLRSRLVALAAAAPGDGLPEPLTLEGELGHDSVDATLVSFLDRLAPFGAGSPEPLFLVRGLSLVSAPRIVGTDHLKLTVSVQGRSMGAIGFGLGRHAGRLRESRGDFALAATPAADDFRGAGAIQLKFKDAGVIP
jgi:single-stranded-DNA-specific exonuclease